MITSIEYYYMHSSESFHTFHRTFYNIPQIICKYSLDFSRTFPGMFRSNPRNVWWHFPECLVTFPLMFNDIPWNVWEHSQEFFTTFPECLATFPGIFENIPRNKTFPMFPAFRSPFQYSWFYIELKQKWHLSFFEIV